MISLLVPTRKRPDKLKRMIQSVRATASNYVEILAYITGEDDSYKEFHETNGMTLLIDEKLRMQCRVVRGPRLIMSDLWNALLPHATGDILMQCADDVILRTPQWDRYVEEAFAAIEDRILLVHGHDCSPNGENFATLPFVHRRWVETVGYFTGPGFSVDFSDTWPNDVAGMIGRKKYLPVVFEHTHWLWGKSEMDETYQEIHKLRLSENTTALYAQRLPERLVDAEKLRAAMR